MRKHHILLMVGFAVLGAYFASTPNDGSNPIASVGGTVFGTVPQALGLGTSLPVYAIEGAAMGYAIGHFWK